MYLLLKMYKHFHILQRENFKNKCIIPILYMYHSFFIFIFSFAKSFKRIFCENDKLYPLVYLLTLLYYILASETLLFFE